MAFSRDTKERALVAAARHCSVCRRAMGLKVEVHHIQPASDGGSDNFDNAIVLCFDCHADAGHYNAKHPKGTKFSPQELRRHRDEWYRIVREHNIEPVLQAPRFHCRYYLCREYEAINEIAQNDLSNFPADKPIMVESDALHFLRELIACHPSQYRDDYMNAGNFKGLEEYLEKHPDSERVDKSETQFAYYDTVRIPSAGEIEEKIAPHDSVSRLLLNERVPVEEIAVAVTFNNPCHGVECDEKYLVRPLNVLFFVAQNISGSSLTVGELAGEVQLDSPAYRRFIPEVNETSKFNLPKAPIAPGETVVIPLVVLLAPIASLSLSIENSDISEVAPGNAQVVSHARVASENKCSFNAIGPSIIPQSIKREGPGSWEPIHTVDLANLYIISRNWAMGSCPHVFFLRKKWQYGGEVLAHCMNTIGESVIEVPDGTDQIMIAELEEESTWLEEVTVGGCKAKRDIKLEKGDCLVFDCKKHGQKQKLLVRGFYKPKVVSSLDELVTRRNAIVCDNVERLNRLTDQQGAALDGAPPRQ